MPKALIIGHQAVPNPETVVKDLGWPLLEASALLARTEGTFICPEGAANLSAAMKLRESGWIKSDEHVVLLTTGSGLKYPETVSVAPPVRLPGDRLTVGGSL